MLGVCMVFASLEFALFSLFRQFVSTWGHSLLQRKGQCEELFTGPIAPGSSAKELNASFVFGPKPHFCCQVKDE